MNALNTCKYCNNGDISKYTPYEHYDVFECNSCKLISWKSIPECCRNPVKKIVAHWIDKFNFLIRIQCENCGGCLNMKKPLEHEKYHKQVKGKFSLVKHTNWITSKTLENEYIFSISKALKFANTNYAKYLNHLKSPYWKNIRKKALERDNNLCQSCLKTPANEIHHLTYLNLGNEKIEDLISLCSECHKNQHLK
jgi:hypothetical protein